MPTLLLLLAACSDHSLAPLASPEHAFDDAAARTDVPRELLLAIAKVETGVQPVVGAEEFPGQLPAFGVMGLRGEALEEAAALSGLDAERVKSDVAANTLAAATLLSAWAAEEGVDPADWSAWAPIVARYSGIGDPEAAAEYVWYEVYAALNEGVDANGYTSEPVDAMPRYPTPSRRFGRTGASDAVWTASPNYSSRGGAAVDFVIIHTCEGGYSGCWSWLADSSSGVSAHYVVNDDGSEVRQLVDEANKAWHISANYDCSYNHGVECERNGTAMNSVSVGVEHAGYGSQSSWNSGLIARSAELTCGVTERQGVTRDSYHIVGHGQLQPWNRTDPGAAWPWTSYLDQVRAACGDGGSSDGGSSDGGGSSSDGGGSSDGGSSDGGGGSSDGGGSSPTAGSFVVDSNNARNDAAWYGIEVSDDWWSSSSTSGYYNTGYWVAPTDSVSDPASFWFRTDAARCYTVEAWWTAGSNRPPSITWMGWDTNDREVGRATVDMQGSGSRWVDLGDWTFGSGWNRVLLSRWTTSGYYAIADAVRLTPC